MGPDKAVADYTLIEPIGPAAFGELWVARAPDRLEADIAQDRLVGLKVAELMDDRAFDRAVRELRVLTNVASPHVVAPLDAGHAGSHLFYTFPLPVNGTLAAPALPLATAARIAAVADAARGAHALHEAGIVHRNVKPATVFLMSDRAVLGDVGLAGVLAAERSVLGPLGAAEYTDPAVLRGGRATRATDVYSLGMTLAWALSEEVLLPTDRSEVSLLRHAVRRRGARNLPAGEAAELVQRCTDPDPARRPATGLEVADLLDRVQLLEADRANARDATMPSTRSTEDEQTGDLQ